jgi:hypothetical protein
MLFLARWARKMSWKETAEAFRTSWDKVSAQIDKEIDLTKQILSKHLRHGYLMQNLAGCATSRF